MKKTADDNLYSARPYEVNGTKIFMAEGIGLVGFIVVIPENYTIRLQELLH